MQQIKEIKCAFVPVVIAHLPHRPLLREVT
jgi:hypothetical protein